MTPKATQSSLVCQKLIIGGPSPFRTNGSLGATMAIALSLPLTSLCNYLYFFREGNGQSWDIRALVVSKYIIYASGPGR